MDGQKNNLAHELANVVWKGVDGLVFNNNWDVHHLVLEFILCELLSMSFCYTTADLENLVLNDQANMPLIQGCLWPKTSWPNFALFYFLLFSNENVANFFSFKIRIVHGSIRHIIYIISTLYYKLYMRFIRFNSKY